MGGEGGRDRAGKLPEVIKSNLVPGNNYDPSVRRSSQPRGLQGPPSSCTCAQGPRERWVNLARGTMVAEALKEARSQGVWFAVFSATLKGTQGKREEGCVRLASLSMGHSGSSLLGWTARGSRSGSHRVPLEMADAV